MIKTREIGKQLLLALGKDPIKAISFIGSQPADLGPASDLDIVIIIDAQRYEEALDLVQSFADKITKNTLLTYSFSNGPIKFEHEALLHFLIFTDNKVNLTDNPSYVAEKESVRYNQQKTATIIYGPALETFAKAEETPSSGEWIFKSIKRYEEKGHILRTWVKDTKWDYKRVKINLSPWQESELLDYYDRWKSKFKQ